MGAIDQVLELLPAGLLSMDVQVDAKVRPVLRFRSSCIDAGTILNADYTAGGTELWVVGPCGGTRDSNDGRVMVRAATHHVDV